MAKIPLSAGFTLIPEGEHVFKIVDVTYKEQFGKLEIKMETKDKLKHTERYNLLDKNGKWSEPAQNAFSYFARIALDDDPAEIDPADLVGHYIKCEVKHDVQPRQDDPSKTITFIRLDKKEKATSFEDEETITPAAAPTVAAPTAVKKPKKFNLDELLG